MSIQVRNLSHIYSKGMPDEQLALDNINFDIYDGEIVGIVGHTGSGKSTLLQHLNGLLKPSSGTIVVGSTEITAPGTAMKEIRQRVGLVFQYPEYQLFEETVAKDVAFGPKNLGLSEAEIEERVKEALELVGLDYELVKDRSPFELSGGQKRRVAIAGVIAMKPQVLVLDEPTAGLDPEGREEILSNIDTYRKAKNATIMMVSHSMGDVARMANRLLVMSGAHLVMDGTPAQVFEHAQELLDMGLDIPEVTRVFLKLQQMGLPVKLVYTIEQAVAELTRLKGGAANA